MTTNIQDYLEKEKQNWRNQTLCLQIILQSWSNQTSTVQAQKQTHRSTEQNRDPRNKLTYIWSINRQQRGKKIYQG